MILRSLLSKLQCSWPDPGEEIHYQVEAREERLPFYAAWTPLPAYYRYNEDKARKTR